MKAIKGYIVLMALTCAGVCSAQVKEKAYEEIQIVGFRVYIPSDSLGLQSIGRLDILELQPDDLGQLLQKFAGATVKNYGGPGSLKTLNFRGIGGQHTRVLMDGFESSDAQSGQLNFGQVPTTNIEVLALGTLDNRIVLTPSSMVSGQVLSLSTNLGRRPERFNSTFKSSFGSFGLFDNSFQIGQSFKKLAIESFARHRMYEGEYPFNIPSSTFSFQGNRAATDLSELYGGLGLHWKHRGGHRSRVIYRVKQIDQSLPGSIVLYNNFSKQFLATQKHQVSLDNVIVTKKIQLRPFINLQSQQVRYTDEHYQNIQGFLEQNYVQSGIHSGMNSLVKLNQNKLILNGGLEHQLDQLVFVNQDGKVVNRHQVMLVEEGNFRRKRLDLKLKLGGNLIFNQDVIGEKHSRHFKPNAGISLNRRLKLEEWFGFSIQSNYAYRLPSFNELYFGQVGNQALLPEDVFQNTIALAASNHSKKFPFTLKIAAYANWVENKIVAIPTKNLFVWSIQNVDQVRILGGDVQFSFSQHWRSNFRSKLEANYSFQNAEDRTPGSITFGDQIAYIPMHSGNVDWSLYYEDAGFRLSNFWTGPRYSLNQNISFNRLVGFQLMDVALFYRWNFKNEHCLRVQGAIKNILNQSVEFVRGFTMPGRNFLISLSYEI